MIMRSQLDIYRYKAEKYPKRKTDHQFITGFTKSILPELVADISNKRGENEVDKLSKLLDHLGETNTPIGIAIRLGKLN